jgi:hypothetical protein
MKMGQSVSSSEGFSAISAAPSSMMSEASARMMADKAVVTNDLPQGEGMQKQVIRTGNLTLQAENVDWMVHEVTRIAENAGGTIDRADISSSRLGVKSGILVVRVPVEQFITVLEQCKQTARLVVRESVSGQDVTEQVIDIQAHINNKQAEEQAYAALLKTSNQKMSDILQVTQALNTVRAEIESLEGQLKYLRTQSDMATINISFSEDAAIGQTQAWRPAQVVKDSVNRLIQGLQGFIDILIRLVIIVLPILLLAFLVFGVILWRVVKRASAWLKGRHEGQ